MVPRFRSATNPVETKYAYALSHEGRKFATQTEMTDLISSHSSRRRHSRYQRHRGTPVTRHAQRRGRHTADRNGCRPLSSALPPARHPQPIRSSSDATRTS
eukprot:TRINITY_DN20574_c0_g1_i1.p2 TRINITY_DN20574_c0_g1~~TRINITY_DN20574_c0_g1_i1.p2  ORF type:complete len:101 (-),score=5.44 TRINITY_DN20574_c0_g1_i1:60-362(-)